MHGRTTPGRGHGEQEPQMELGLELELKKIEMDGVVAVPFERGRGPAGSV